MRKLWILFLTIPSLFIVSCKGESSYSGCWSETEDGWYRFYSNDEDDYYTDHYRVWDSASSFPLTVKFRKKSGYDEGFFGVVFAYQTDGSYYQALTNINGDSCLFCVDSEGTWTDCIYWVNGEDYDFAKKGFGAENAVTIYYDDPTYTFYLNGIFAGEFNRDEGDFPDLSGGSAGFVAQVGVEENEAFPETPVVVDFQMLQPVLIP